jgi:hypothetical protein
LNVISPSCARAAQVASMSGVPKSKRRPSGRIVE